MGDEERRKAERREAAAVVARHHEEELERLLAHVHHALDEHTAGRLDPFEVDEIVHRYSKAARGLWKFCKAARPEQVARAIRDLEQRGECIDWWQDGASAGRR